MSVRPNELILAAPSVDTARLRISDLRSSHAGPFHLTVESGECLVVRGPSGVGKSLLLRMIADLDENAGRVALDGVIRETISAPAWRRLVIYQSAEPAWWESTAAGHFSDAQRADALAMLPDVGLDIQHLDRDITLLSTGERQRMALIRSLVYRPQVLLLDEPTASLDHASTLMVEALLRSRVAAGMAIVFVTHSLEQAMRVGDRELVLEARPPA